MLNVGACRSYNWICAVGGEFLRSCDDGRLIKAATMFLPAVSFLSTTHTFDRPSNRGRLITIGDVPIPASDRECRIRVRRTSSFNSNGIALRRIAEL
jgi:hypothetical protein